MEKWIGKIATICGVGSWISLFWLMMGYGLYGNDFLFYLSLFFGFLAMEIGVVDIFK